MSDAKGGDRISRSYAAGGRMARERLTREAPDAAEALARAEASDIVVVRGCYDRVEQVLGALDLPFTVVDPGSVERLTLRPEQLLVVNCPGEVSGAAITAIRCFVERGGSLLTTDWALRHVIEPAFPGVLAYNGHATTDAVLRVEVCSHDNPFLRGVMDEGDDPQWWLEGSSYPIRILDPGRVEVLLRSRELGEKWGEEPVAVLFHHGEGEVFHMISHYYLQRTERGTARHQAPAADYAAAKGVGLRFEEADLTVGEVESAASSARWIANVVADKQLRRRAPRKKETR